MALKYIARHDRVWQHKVTKEINGNAIELKKGERIADYKEIPDPNKKKTAAVKADKQPQAISTAKTVNEGDKK